MFGLSKEVIEIAIGALLVVGALGVIVNTRLAQRRNEAFVRKLREARSFSGGRVR